MARTSMGGVVIKGPKSRTEHRRGRHRARVRAQRRSRSCRVRAETILSAPASGRSRGGEVRRKRLDSYYEAHVGVGRVAGGDQVGLDGAACRSSARSKGRGPDDFRAPRRPRRRRGRYCMPDETGLRHSLAAINAQEIEATGTRETDRR